MKKRILLSAVLFISMGITLFADPPPPPPDPSGGGGSGGPVGAPIGAPIDGGLGILMLMGAVYGGRKYYKEI